MGNIELVSLRYSGWGRDKGRGRVKVKSNWATETYLTTSMRTTTNIAFKYFMINSGVGHNFCLNKYRGQNRWDAIFESAS